MKTRTLLVSTFTVLLTILVVVASIFFGVGNTTAKEVLGTIAAGLGLDGRWGLPDAPSAVRQAIIWDLRIPRVLMAMIAGAGLAISGAALQAITRNDLAEPYLLGVSYGASAGAVITLIFAGSILSLTTGAFLGALMAMGLLLLLLRGSGLSPTRVVLTGVLIGQFFNAITSLVLHGRGNAEQIQGLTFWLNGALSASRWDTLGLACLSVVVATLIFWVGHKYLDMMAFGDDTAKSMGVHVLGVRLVVLVVVAFMTAALVSAVGAIGFVGLLVPHAVRMVVGSTHKVLIPLSALAGGIFLVVCDAISRTIFSPQELPVGVVTAIIGVPLFFLILKRKKVV